MVNTLAHSLEVAHQAGIIVAVTGGDKKLVKRVSLLQGKGFFKFKKTRLLKF
jgi:hypothetical protein